ncbi:MAG: 2,3,4,5-tetrahydropyridine-2,6-dicarboxylate N-acetyltransferase [Candidatus Omnitrophica bacterium]|nr:2,3,4,5-tetrahydropyridine-2,6-dicarboxylate N-acetyltransferase [Candidatus Omnitrophota bacterium]
MIEELLWGLAVLVLSVAALKIVVFGTVFRHEIKATLERDPAASGPLTVLLTYPGLHALIAYRMAHALHGAGLRFPARVLSQASRFFTGIEIHPGARIGKGLFIDHGMGVVIGETSVLGDNVTLFQGVTLGGTGKDKGKRHPTLGNNVTVGAGAKVLGNIRIGDNVSIGANAVVIRDVPPNSTVVGVPGRIARREGRRTSESADLDHGNLPDPLQQALERLRREVHKIEHELREGHESQERQRERRGDKNAG